MLRAYHMVSYCWIVTLAYVALHFYSPNRDSAWKMANDVGKLMLSPIIFVILAVNIPFDSERL